MQLNQAIQTLNKYIKQFQITKKNQMVFLNVRNVNSCSSNYQLNPVYKSERRQMFLTDNGTLKTYVYNSYTRVKIWNSLARMKFMLDFYIRNYKQNTNTKG